MTGRPITAVIGIRNSGPLTWYVKRSQHMANYPGVWSLPSIQFVPDELPDIHDLKTVADHFRRLSAERLGSVDMDVLGHMTSGTSDVNPMGVDVTLHLYRIEMLTEPALDPKFYVDSGWLDVDEYERRSIGQPCGLCTRLWSDYAWLSGITDRPIDLGPTAR